MVDALLHFVGLAVIGGFLFCIPACFVAGFVEPDDEEDDPTCPTL